MSAKKTGESLEREKRRRTWMSFYSSGQTEALQNNLWTFQCCF